MAKLSKGSLVGLSFLPLVAIGQDSPELKKRGLVYIDTDNEADTRLLTSGESPMTWYYTYSTYQTLQGTDLEFAPMIHGSDDAGDAVSRIRDLGSNISHVLVYNEPDGSTDSGGSNVDPEDAARTYLDTIASLREDGLKLSVPATTGSEPGLDWLRQFNESCFDLSDDGCEFDFVAAHWYGDFPAMADWLGTLHELYPQLPIWLTEFALPAQDEDATFDFVNKSLPYLDELDYVERYAYFGTFREDNANDFTGEKVALLDDDGGLTDIGALYLGGEQRGFESGDKGNFGSDVPVPAGLLFCLAAAATTLMMGW